MRIEQLEIIEHPRPHHALAIKKRSLKRRNYPPIAARDERVDRKFANLDGAIIERVVEQRKRGGKITILDDEQRGQAHLFEGILQRQSQQCRSLGFRPIRVGSEMAQCRQTIFDSCPGIAPENRCETFLHGRRREFQ